MQRFNNILCVIAPDADQRWVLERALTLAQSNQARLTVLTVLEPVPALADIVPQTVERALEQRFADHVAALLQGLAGAAPQVKAVFGRGYLEVIREVLRHDYDLVLKPATPDVELKALLFGSNDMHLLRKCPCPVWLLKQGGRMPYRRILAAVDFDPAVGSEVTVALGRRILELAAALSLAEFAELHVVHVWEAAAENVLRVWGSSSSEATIAEYVALERQRHAQGMEALMTVLAGCIGQEAMDYLKPRLHLPRGNAGKEVPALVQSLDADLVVMGTVGRSGIPGLIIGNTAETILHKVDCAVLALKPPGFVSPVTL